MVWIIGYAVATGTGLLYAPVSLIIPTNASLFVLSFGFWRIYPILVGIYPILVVIASLYAEQYREAKSTMVDFMIFLTIKLIHYSQSYVLAHIF